MPLPNRRLPLCKRMSGRTIEVYGSADHFNTLEHSRHCLQALCFLPRQQPAARHIVSNRQTAGWARLRLRQASAARCIMTGLHDLHVTPQQRPRADLPPIPPGRLERPRGCSRYFQERLPVSWRRCARGLVFWRGCARGPVFWRGCARGIVWRMVSSASRHSVRHSGQAKALPRMNALLSFQISTRTFDMDRVIEASHATPTPAVVTPKEPVHARCP
jgi:hypothetical protein